MALRFAGATVKSNFSSFSDCVGSGFTLEASLNFCYQISTFKATWNDAFDDCDAKDAHLVLLDSKAKDDFLTTQLDTRNNLYK